MDQSGDDRWDATRYDEEATYVFERGEALLEHLSPSGDERILDLGCGTGHLSDQIAATGADVVGVDRSREMILRARKSYDRPSFVHADATTYETDHMYDAVFSNAALHWISDQDAVLDTVSDVLKPGGRFVAELGGQGNVSSITSVLHAELSERGYELADIWYFPSIGEYTPLIEENGFEVVYARLFDRPTPLEEGPNGLREWIELFASDLLTPLTQAEREAVISATEDSLRPKLFENGQWIADYRRLRFVAYALE